MEWDGLTAVVFMGNILDEAAGLLAAGGILTTCDVWKRAEIYIFAVSFSFRYGPLHGYD